MIFGRSRKYGVLEKAIGYKFKNEALIEAALTHRSYRFERSDVEQDNQRLEFLGDAVLGFLAAAYLYERHDGHSEGTLTAMRSAATSGKALAALAKACDLGEFLLIGKGEARSGGRSRPSNLTDAMEAVLGAAYVDGGIKAAGKVFAKLIAPLFEDPGEDGLRGNPKGALQEYSQRQYRTSPRYRVVRVDGPPHALLFTVEASVSDTMLAQGVGTNKQAAETEAAARLLARIEAGAESQKGAKPDESGETGDPGVGGG